MTTVTIKLKSTGCEDGCLGCFFEDAYEGCVVPDGPELECRASHRPDGESVIWLLEEVRSEEPGAEASG